MAPSRKQFNTGSIYIHMAVFKILIDAGKKKVRFVSSRGHLGMTELTNINLKAKRKTF